MFLDDRQGIIRVRSALPSDVPTFSTWIGREFPIPSPLAAALPTLLKHLIANDTLGATVAEHVADGCSAPVLLAFGISGFLSNASVTKYLAAPYPHFEIDLLDCARRGTSSFLSYDEIARANATDGATLFPLMWLQRTDDPADPEARALLTVCQQTFLRVHRGYRLSRILKEASVDRAQAFLNGGFRERHRLPIGTPLPFSGRKLAREHVVFEITMAEVQATLPGTAVGHLFTYRPPRCGFTRAEKQVLTKATDGLTDAKIAHQLDITAPAVALRWRSIYARVTTRVPSALQPYERTPPNHRRGQEKRRQVIAFVNDHPEEIRPYREA